MKHIEEIIHLCLVLFSGFLIILAHYFDLHKEIFEFVAIFILTMGSLALLIYKANKNESDEIKLVPTFIWNEFSSTRLGKFLTFNEDIFIVEAQSQENSFKTRLGEFYNEEIGKNLTIKYFNWDNSDAVNQKKRFSEKLKGAKAVLVFRTKELEKTKWVYEVVEEWAKKNPEAPCLYIDAIEYKYRKSEIPNNYYWIPDAPKSVPWRLLQRSGERGLAWRTQASFNRTIWKHTIILLFLVIAVWIYNHYEHSKEMLNTQSEFSKKITSINTEHNNEITNKNNEISELQKSNFDNLALNTKFQIDDLIFKNAEKTLFVSYWLYNEKATKPITQVGTTDINSNLTPWEKQTNNIVGCAFVNENHFVEWDGELYAKVFSIEGQEKPDLKCNFTKRPQDEINSVACFVSNKTGNSKDAVGICIKTEGKTEKGFELIISQLNYRELLKQKALELYQDNLKKQYTDNF